MEKYALSKLNYPHPKPKPRTKGLTMFTDLGLGLEEQKDLMNTTHEIADFAKFATSMCATLPKELIKEKVSIYKKFGVEAFPGGVLFEHALYDHGIAIADYYFEEMASLGIATVEVSDNYLDLTLKSKCKLIELGKQKYGFKMFAEAGDELEDTPIELLVDDCKSSLEAGAYKVLLEAAELMDKETKTIRLGHLDVLNDKIGFENLIFELPWVWLADVHWHQTFSTLGLMIEKLGSEVNLGNVESSMLVWCEMIRNGAGTKLKKDRQI